MAMTTPTPSQYVVLHCLVRYGKEEGTKRLSIKWESARQSLNAMQESVGFTLFTLDSGLEFTPAALQIAEIMGRIIEPLVDLILQLQQQKEHGIALAASLHVLSAYLPPVEAAFRAKHPNVVLGHRSGGQMEVEACLKRGEAEVAIAALRFAPAEFERKLLVRIPPILIVRKDSPYRSFDDVLAPWPARQPLVTPPLSEGVTVAFQEELARRDKSWPATSVVSIERVAMEVILNNCIGLTLGVPSLYPRSKVRVLALPGCEEVEYGVLWRRPGSEHLHHLLEIIGAVAQQHWPGATASVSPLPRAAKA